MIYEDCETCGLFGMPVLIQYAEDDGPIILFEPWKNPIIDTLKLIDWFCQNAVCGFNLVFDWFHLCKIYTTFSLFPDPYAIPEDHIDELAVLEEQARFKGMCIKPKAALDLMLESRKGKYQSLMQRDEVRVRKVPTQLAWHLASELEKRVKIDDIYFAKKKDKFAPKWSVRDIEDVPEFKDIVLNFHPSGALKTLAQHALGIEPDLILKFGNIGLDDYWNPNEVGYAPFALALGKPGAWNHTWPEVIHKHISHWAYSDLARKYAGDDIKYTRLLRAHFGNPPAGDDDSELACMVAACRWKGFALDFTRLKRLRKAAYLRMGNTPQAPGPVRAYLSPHLSEIEKVVIDDSTEAVVLEEIATWRIACDCLKSNETQIKEDGTIYDSNCPKCKGLGTIKHAAATPAQEVLDARGAKKEIELYDKLLLAKRFHASFKVIGAKSSRMAGTDELNPQAIKRGRRYRRAFLFADSDNILSGGDFDSFEVVIAEASYNDPKLREDLLSGKKIHALFAEELFPGNSYADILASKDVNNMYTDGKQGVFAIIYGGNEQTLKNKLGVDIETGNKAYTGFLLRYPNIGKERKKIFDSFCSMRQPNGIGTKVEWKEPADYIESMLGFRRYFTLENKVCKVLFELGQNPPKDWRGIKFKVVRRDREQSVYGATQSALYAAAFNIQASNMRAAANHVIQSTGAQITKRVQRNTWNLQPYGIHEWRVQPFNSHDEIETVHKDSYTNIVKEAVQNTVESFRKKIPLIKMEWKVGMKSWADK